MAWRWVISLVALWCVVGCGSVQRPTASVKGMSLGEVTAGGFTMNFDVALHNPNGVALPVGDVKYGLQLAERDLLQGDVKPEQSIPAQGDLAVTVPVTVSFESLVGVAEAIGRSGGNVPYAWDATFEFSTGPLGLQPIKVPLRYSGQLRLKEMLRDPVLLLKSPAARKVAERVLMGASGR